MRKGFTDKGVDLESKPETLTVAARISKHRKVDVLPLHSELVPLIREWTQNLAPRTEPLFPKLAKRRARKCVKLDLERVGIPYRNDEGFADFHASGRTYVTLQSLLANGATLPEAKSARAPQLHFDDNEVRPHWNRRPSKGTSSYPCSSRRKTCQDIVRKPGVSTRQSEASADRRR